MRLQSKVMMVGALFLVFSMPALAQRTTATFAGIVTDTAGAVIPGADVQLINEGTGSVMQQQTTSTGEFLFNFVPVGSYTLRIAGQGFKGYDSRQIALGAAQNVRRTFTLEVGSVQETVEVTGQAPLVNAISSEQRLNLETVQVESLPLANRNITNLLNLSSGTTRQDATDGGNPGRLRLNGLGGSAMAVTANGSDANGNAGAPTISQYNGINKIDVMSVEAIGEVQIVKGVVPAEYGYAMGGNLNLITKSGTNRWHGSLFHRYEGSVLSAKNQFLAKEPRSVWNQFGGSIGGPIRKDQLFFFLAYEGYRQRTATPLNANVPTELFRQTILTALPFPETQLVLDRYPLPSQPTAPGALLGVFNGPGDKSADDDHFDAKVDLFLRGGNLSATFTWGHPLLALPTALPAVQRTYTSVTRRANVSYVIGRNNWTSETRVGYNAQRFWRIDAFSKVLDPNHPTGIFGDRRVPTFSFPGMTGFSAETHIRGIAPTYSVNQVIAIVTGQHTLKMGGTFYRPGGGRPNGPTPVIAFQSLAGLQANTPSSILAEIGAPEFSWTVNNFGFFVQDDWRVSRKLVLNLGLRYDFMGRFQVKPVHDNATADLFNRELTLGDKSFAFGPPRNPPTENDAINIGPRFGFAYNIDEHEKTILHGGFGVMFQNNDPQNFEPAVGISPDIPGTIAFSTQEAAARNFRYPTYTEDVYKRLLAEPPGNRPVSSWGFYDPNIESPYAMNFTLGVQRQLSNSMMLETAFVGTRGVKFTMYRRFNQVDRVTGIRPNPNLTEGNYVDDSESTSYYSWQTSLRRRFSRNLLFNVHHTWGKAMALAGGDISGNWVGDSTGASSIQDFFNLRPERSLASGDITHLFTVDVVYSMPEFRSVRSSLLQQLVGNWEISGIFRTNTGLPLDITQTSQVGSRPDVLDQKNAINHKCCSVENLQYLNPGVFQRVPVSAASNSTVRPGNLKHNALRAPGLVNVDLSIGKRFTMGEGRALQIRADALNALNHTNYTAVQRSINAGNFGQITGSAGARVIQVQGRISF